MLGDTVPAHEGAGAIEVTPHPDVRHAVLAAAGLACLMACCTDPDGD